MGVHAYTAFVAALAALSVPAAAQYDGWAKSKKIVMNTSSTGADVSGDVKGFPVPVILGQGNFDFSQAKADGSDLRFSSASGAPLPYQIEAWDAAGQKAAVWVKSDVKGNDASQFINMHWGNPGATSESDGAKVFDRADGWLGAWHLSEKGSTVAGGYKDASGQADGKGVNITGDATAAGRVGQAVSLARANKEYVVIPGSASSPLFNPLPTKGTFSIWANSKSHTTAYIGMFAKGESGFRIHFFGTGTQTEPCIDVSTYDFCLPSRAKHENNNWYHYTLVINKPGMWYYANGALDKTENDDNGWKTAGTEPVTIGNNEKTEGLNERNRSFDGMLDEARILSVPKDPNWIKLDFESQKEGSKFLQISASTSLRPRNLAQVLPGVAATLRRYDLHGRLAAEVRSAGDRKADLAALRAASGPGVFVDELSSESGKVVTARQALVE